MNDEPNEKEIQLWRNGNGRKAMLDFHHRTKTTTPRSMKETIRVLSEAVHSKKQAP